MTKNNINPQLQKVEIPIFKIPRKYFYFFPEFYFQESENETVSLGSKVKFIKNLDGLTKTLSSLKEELKKSDIDENQEIELRTLHPEDHIVVYYTRLENEQEYEKRIEVESNLLQEKRKIEKERKEKMKKEMEEKQRIIYEHLKKKFENVKQ